MTHQIDELHGKGSLDKIKQYHKDASAISTDSYDAKSYHDASVRRSEFLGKREKAKADIAKAKKGSTREKGWRNYLQSKDDSERQRNWSQRHRNKLSPAEKRIHNTYLKARGVQEDAPTVNAGSGNIAGIGVGAKGEPGVSPRHQPKRIKSVANPIVADMMRRRSPVMEQEQIDELSRKTLSNYIKKASDNRAKNQGEFDFYYKKKNSKKYGKAFRNVLNRRKGIRTATDKLVKESATMAALAAGSALGAAAAPHINKAVGKGLDWLEKKRKQKHQDHYDKKSRRIVKEETFAGAMVFEVSSKLFYNITLQKRKGKHWRTYLEEDDCYAEIREWARKHPKGKIVVRNENTGEIRYIRY